VPGIPYISLSFCPCALIEIHGVEAGVFYSTNGVPGANDDLCIEVDLAELVSVVRSQNEMLA
jgi:hypothetical protein